MSEELEYKMLHAIITHPDNFNSYMEDYKVVRTYDVIGGLDVCLESPCGYYNEVVTVTHLKVALHFNQTQMELERAVVSLNSLLGDRITKLEEKLNDL